jgi:hypothetical protein
MEEYKYNLADNETLTGDIGKRLKLHKNQIIQDIIDFTNSKDNYGNYAENICLNVFGGGNLNNQVRNHPFLDIIVNENDDITKDDELISIKSSIDPNKFTLNMILNTTKAISILNVFNYVIFCLNNFSSNSYNYKKVIKKIADNIKDSNIDIRDKEKYIRYNFIRFMIYILNNKLDVPFEISMNIDDIDAITQELKTKLNDNNVLNNINISIVTCHLENKSEFLNDNSDMFNYKIIIHKTKTIKLNDYIIKIIEQTAISLVKKLSLNIQQEKFYNELFEFIKIVIETGDVSKIRQIKDNEVTDKLKVSSLIARSDFGDDYKNKLKVLKDVVIKLSDDDSDVVVKRFRDFIDTL